MAVWYRANFILLIIFNGIRDQRAIQNFSYSAVGGFCIVQPAAPHPGSLYFPAAFECVKKAADQTAGCP